MQRKLLIGLLALLGSFSFAYSVLASTTVSQSLLTDGHYQAITTDNGGSYTNDRAYFYASTVSGNGDQNTYGLGNILYPKNVDFSALGYGSYHLVLTHPAGGFANNSCTTETYSVCLSDITTNGDTYVDYVVYYNAPTPPKPYGEGLSVASTTGVIGPAVSNTAQIIVYTLGGILLTGTALLGLGFAWRHLKKYVVGGRNI